MFTKKNLRWRELTKEKMIDLIKLYKSNPKEFVNEISQYIHWKSKSARKNFYQYVKQYDKYNDIKYKDNRVILSIELKRKLVNMYNSNFEVFINEYKKYYDWDQRRNRKRFYKWTRNPDVNTSLSSDDNNDNLKNNNTYKKPKKNHIDSSYIDKEDIDDFLDLLNEMLRDKSNKEYLEKYYDIIRKDRTKCRSFEKSKMISKSTVSRIRNNQVYIDRNYQYKQGLIDNAIIDIFTYFKRNIGREVVCERLSKIVFKDLEGNNFSSELTDRQVGNRMNKLKLFCKIRKARHKIKEIKDTTYNCEDLVQRDFDNTSHEDEIFATDVTYLPATKDAAFNNVFLSVVISHKTKQIIGWSLSAYNNLELVLDNFKKIELKKGSIIHSDHGNQYSSYWFKEYIKKKKLKQSMSRVGNSLDNRVVEFFFSIIKTEFIYKTDISSMTLKELEEKIDNYMKYYNEMRIQKKLGWKAPNLYEFVQRNKNNVENIKLLD